MLITEENLWLRPTEGADCTLMYCPIKLIRICHNLGEDFGYL